MSKIQQALRKIQAERAAATRATPVRAVDREDTAELEMPVALHGNTATQTDFSSSARNTFTSLPVHHVDIDSLTRAGLLAPETNSSRLEDEFRRIKRPLLKNVSGMHSIPDKHSNVIMIAAPLPKVGKTFCALNLALSICMERDRQVLLVDADVAKGHLSREMGLADHKGLLDILDDSVTDLSSLIVPTDLVDLRLLPAGAPRPNATELLASRHMGRLVDELSKRYSDRVIIFDTPPLLLTTEAQALSTQMGQIVLVIAADDTPHESVQQAIDTLDTNKPVNLILNKVWRMSKLYQYGDEYGYYS